MAKRHRSARLTGVDTLAVASACLLFILLVPVLLARPRERAVRAVCAANLMQIGKTSFVYAGDYEGELPRAGGRSTVWGKVKDFAGPDRYQAYGLSAYGDGGTASISSCLYLLVKYYQAPPRLFICRGDKGATEFQLSKLPPGVVPASFKLADGWDFGPHLSATDYLGTHCSYAYHTPYGFLSLTTSRDPNLAVAADRNPWIRGPAADPMPFAGFVPDLPDYGGNAVQATRGNAITHESDGQNVLFLDGRVTFEKRPFCGVGKDNIYTVSQRGPDVGDPLGAMPNVTSEPMSAKDSLLIHDDPNYVPPPFPTRFR